MTDLKNHYNKNVHNLKLNH